MCKVTISTVTYNREHLLPRAIESVLGQTFRDFEYLIINNGSTDGTAKILEKYSSQDKRIKIISFEENKVDSSSVYERWSIFTKNEEIPYITHVDDDDYIKPGMVETLYRLITEHDADMASVGSVFFYPDGTEKNKFVFDGKYIYSRVEAMTEFLKREKFNAAKGGKLFRKTVYQNLTLPEVDVARDIYSSYRIMNNVNKMVVTGEPMYYFYRHDKNMSGLDSPEQITPVRMRQHLEANAIRTEWLSERMPEIKHFVLYCELSFIISLFERIHRLKVADCFDIANEMKITLRRHQPFLSQQEYLTVREKEILNSILQKNG